MNIAVVDEAQALEKALHERVSNERPNVSLVGFQKSAGQTGLSALKDAGVEALVYVPRWNKGEVDLGHARNAFGIAKEMGAHVVLISSVFVYFPRHSNPGFLNESRPTVSKAPNARSQQLVKLERIVKETITPAQLTVLRTAPMLSRQRGCVVSRRFTNRLATRCWGYDPMVQLLDIGDLATAVLKVISERTGGVFNVAPDDAIHIKKLLKLNRGWMPRIPITRVMHKGASMVLGKWMSPTSDTDFVRHSITVDNQKLKLATGWTPERTTIQSLAKFNGIPDPKINPDDRLGLDRDYLNRQQRYLFRFLERIYWRAEFTGMEHVPANGPAVLVAVHRGFMPFDGVMIVHLLSKYAKRIPRFLIHPTLVKFPVLAPFLTKIGGVIASGENANHVLAEGEIVGFFPEGIRGAVRMYDRAYDFAKFGRHDYVKLAIQHQVPIILVIPLGPAEALPIIKRIDLKWFRRWSEWPFLPLTPVWPWFPFPLPTKWHFRTLPPIETNHLDPSAANDLQVVEELHDRVREQVSENIEQMRQKRKSFFWGKLD